MIRKELVHHVLHDTGYDAEVVEKIILSALDNIKIAIARGEEVNLRGFGLFKPWVTKERTARDIRRGVQVTVPPKHKVKFVPSILLKDMLKSLE